MSDLDPIHAALGRVVDPCSIATGVPINLLDMGMVKQVVDEQGVVCVTLRLTSPICWQAGNIIAAVEAAVGALPGVVSVECRLDPGVEWMPDMMSQDARAKLRRLRPLPVEA
jgi:metal-sulfur cluster biosynthetic enzyme